MSDKDRFLLHLVDVVWGDAMEDGQVPSTEHANHLISKARKTIECIEPMHDHGDGCPDPDCPSGEGGILTEGAIQRCDGCGVKTTTYKRLDGVLICCRCGKVRPTAPAEPFRCMFDPECSDPEPHKHAAGSKLPSEVEATQARAVYLAGGSPRARPVIPPRSDIASVMAAKSDELVNGAKQSGQLGLRSCENCGGSGPCLIRSPTNTCSAISHGRRSRNAESGSFFGYYLCRSCHPEPDDSFFTKGGAKQSGQEKEEGAPPTPMLDAIRPQIRAAKPGDTPATRWCCMTCGTEGDIGDGSSGEHDCGPEGCSDIVFSMWFSAGPSVRVAGTRIVSRHDAASLRESTGKGSNPTNTINTPQSIISNLQ